MGVTLDFFFLLGSLFYVIYFQVFIVKFIFKVYKLNIRLLYYFVCVVCMYVCTCVEDIQVHTHIDYGYLQL